MADDTAPVNKIVDVVPPTISRHGAAMATDATKAPGAIPESPEALRQVSSTAQTVTPPVSTEAPSSEPEPTATPDVAPPVAPQEESPAPAPAPSAPYEATDSLPDTNAIETTQATDNMQSPRIYDTKEYVVPIKDTMHSHGTLGKIVAAFVSVAVMLGILYVVVMYVV
jgi:hypothetical protein